MQSFWDQYWKQSSVGECDPDIEFVKHATNLKPIIEQINKKKNSNGNKLLAVDLGTGGGENAVWLAENGWTVWAVDYAASSIEATKQLLKQKINLSEKEQQQFGDNIQCQVADITTWTLPPSTSPPNKADLVSLVFIHFPPKQRQALFNNIMEHILEKNGFLLYVGIRMTEDHELEASANQDHQVEEHCSNNQTKHEENNEILNDVNLNEMFVSAETIASELRHQSYGSWEIVHVGEKERQVQMSSDKFEKQIGVVVIAKRIK